MRPNPFRNIDRKSDRKTLQLTETETVVAEKNAIVQDIFEYIKIRIEMGIFDPIELIDVYGYDTYIGIQIPRDLEIILNKKETLIKQEDYIVVDFDKNIFHTKKEDFTSFYRVSQTSPYQQLLSAIQLFGITASADEVFVKSSYNKTLRGSEDVIFDKLAEMIMLGNVEQKYVDAYRTIIEEKYRNELINYTILSDYKAKYLMKKLKEKDIPFALLSPLVDSIYEMDDGDFDVDSIIAVNNYLSLIITVASGAGAVAACIAQMNKEIAENRDLLGMASSVDSMSVDELIAFKAQFDAAGICIPCVNPDKILEQMKQEVIEEKEIHGNDILSQDSEDLLL